MRYVGFTGFQGVGKSSIAEALYNLRKDKAVIRPFAAPLKALASYMYGVDIQRFENWKAKDHKLAHLGHTPRELLLKLSAELKEEYGQRILLDIYQKGLAILPDDAIVIIPDVRLDMEAAWIRDNGGSIIAVTSPYINRYKQRNHMDTCLKGDYTIYMGKIKPGILDPEVVSEAAKHIKYVLEL